MITLKNYIFNIAQDANVRNEYHDYTKEQQKVVVKLYAEESPTYYADLVSDAIADLAPHIQRNLLLPNATTEDNAAARDVLCSKVFEMIKGELELIEDEQAHELEQIRQAKLRGHLNYILGAA